MFSVLNILGVNNTQKKGEKFMKQALMVTERLAFNAFNQAISRYGAHAAETLDAKERWETAKAELLSFMKGGVSA